MTRFDWPIPFGTPVIETETGWRGMVVDCEVAGRTAFVRLVPLREVDYQFGRSFRLIPTYRLREAYAPLTSPLRPRNDE